MKYTRPEPLTENQKLIDRLRLKTLKHCEIEDLYDLLKENMARSEFCPIDDILDEKMG